MNRAKAENNVRLVVNEFDCDPDEITKILGVLPTKTARRGDLKIEGGTRRWTHNWWNLKSPVDPTVATGEEAVTALLDLLPDPSAFGRLPPGSEVEVGCLLMGYAYRPWLHLSPPVMARLASIGAALDVDPYDMTTDDEPETGDAEAGEQTPRP